MQRHACSFKNCTNVDRKSNCRFFHFPQADNERCRQWIELSGNDSLLKLNKSQLSKVKVCSAHFNLDQILGSGRLLSGSLPSPYQHSPATINTNVAGSVNDNVSSTGAVSSTPSGPSTTAAPSQRVPERDNVPPFIIVHEIVDVTIDLIDEDDVPDYVGIIAKAEYNVDKEVLSSLEEEGYGTETDIVSLPDCDELVAETDAASNSLTSNYNPDQHLSDIENDPINLANEAPEILEERDPLAMEVDDDPSNNAERPLFAKLFAETDAESDTLIFNDIGRNQPDNLANKMINNFETTDNGEIPTLIGDVDHDMQVTRTYTRATSNNPLIDSQQMPQQPCVIKQLLATPFCLLSENKQREIVNAGRPMPIKLYGTNQAHLEVAEHNKCTWITGSRVLKKLFCWPCLLFSCINESVHWTTLGYDFLQPLNQAIRIHENSRIHKQCSMTLSMFKNANVGCLERKKHHEETKKNRDILERIIDCLCLLAKLNVPFRNCEEGNSSLLHGAYVAIIKSLSEYDQLLKHHLETSNVNTFTSSMIRDRLIIAIRTVLRNKIKQEVEGSKFVSIILCQTSGTIKGPQLSVVLRYVDKERVLQERFIGYKDVGSSSALFDNEHLVKYVTRIITEFKIQTKLVALSYSGPLIELCSDIKAKYPRALIIHNHYENKLSSIFRRACSSIKECRLYIATIADIAKFFSSESNVQKLNLFVSSKFKKSLSFSVFSSLERTVCEFLPEFLAFFKGISENPNNWSSETVLKAQGYQCFFEDFSNTFLLFTSARVFALTMKLDHRGLSNTRDCFDKEGKFREFLMEEGTHFLQIWEDVKIKRRECNLEPEPVQVKRKKVITYSRKRSELEDPKNVFKLLFKKVISFYIDHMKDHFSYVKSLQFNALLNLSDAAQYRRRFPIESFEVLQTTYPRLLNEVELKCQLASLYRLIQYKEIPQLELMSLMRIFDVDNVMPEVYTLACLCSTIPVTTPSNEISNSAIMRINHLSETLGQRRMSNLALLSLENNFLCQLKELPNFYSEVLDEFANNQ